MSVITERDARHGKFKIFDDPEMTVNIRSINSTEEWLDECAKVDEAWEKASAEGGTREDQKAYTKALYDTFFAYDESVNREAIEDKVTAAQIVEAFRVMREEFDPFVQTQKKKQEERDRQLTESLRVIEHLPKEVIEKLPDIIQQEGGLKL